MKEKSSFEDIYSAYINDLFRYLFSLTQNKEAAEDLMQDTFYRALIHLDSYKGEEIKPWLFRIAYNAFIDAYRKTKRLSNEEIEEWHLPSSPSAEEQTIKRAEIYEWIKSLNVLPASTKNILLLKDYHGFSYQEISELTGYTIGKIKMDLFRGRKELKKVREQNDLS